MKVTTSLNTFIVEIILKDVLSLFKQEYFKTLVIFNGLKESQGKKKDQFFGPIHDDFED